MIQFLILKNHSKKKIIQKIYNFLCDFIIIYSIFYKFNYTLFLLKLKYYFKYLLKTNSFTFSIFIILNKEL